MPINNYGNDFTNNLPSKFDNQAFKSCCYCQKYIIWKEDFRASVDAVLSNFMKIVEIRRGLKLMRCCLKAYCLIIYTYFSSMMIMHSFSIIV